MRPAISLALSVIGLAAGVPAQRTWVVDGGGFGVFDFRDIPPAVAAAAPGDTIVVKWGSSFIYTAPTIDRPVRLVGLRDHVDEPIVVPGLWVVRDIPAGGEVVISNVFVTGPRVIGFPHGMVATNCAGRIHLEKVWIDGGGLANGQISFVDCADVSIHAGTFVAGDQPVHFVRSQVRIANSSVTGRSWSIGWNTAPPGEAMRVENGDVRLVGSRVKGGDLPSGNATAMAGIVLANGTVYAGPDVRIVPGEVTNCGGPTCTLGVGAIGTGTIWRDPLSALVWQYPILLPPTVQMRSLQQPATNLDPVTRGLTFRTRVHGPPGGFALLALGLPSWSPTPTPLGELWLDPSLILHVGAGPLPSTTGVFEQTYLCWSGAPIDLLLCYQGAVIWPDGRIALTEPVRFTVQWPFGQPWL